MIQEKPHTPTCHLCASICPPYMGMTDCSQMKTSFPLTEKSDILDLRRHSRMFSPSWRRSSPFSLTELDMWDTKTRFTAQSSEWSGMETASGSEFLSRVSSRQRDPGLQRWRSLSHLAPESVARSCSPSGAELGAARRPNSFRQAEVVQWLQNAHERLDNKLDQLWTRDLQRNYNSTTGQKLDIKTKLSKLMSAVEQEAAEFSEFEKTPQCGELQEKSTLNKEGYDELNGSLRPNSISRTEENREDFNKLEKRKVDTELRAALRETEARAASLEEERKKVLHQLQKSAETQKMMQNQMEEKNKKLFQTVQNHSDMQEQLSEANNKISQACLEKAVLSTQVLKLEDNIRELKTKLCGALSEKDHLMQEKEELLQRAQILELQLERTKQESLTDGEYQSHEDQETVLMMEDSRALRQVNEKLRADVDMFRQSLDKSQCRVKELTEERITSAKKIAALEMQRSQLIREKEELLSKINLGGFAVTEKPKEKCCCHKESVEVLQVEIQKLQDQHLHIEGQVREKENMLQRQEEEFGKQDKERVKCIEELKAVASHWTEKWQKVALALQSAQDELEEFKKNSFINVRDVESESRLKGEFDTCKQELEQVKRRNQALLQRYQDEGDKSVETLDKETVTDWSGSSLICEHPSDSQSTQNKSAQVWMHSSETERLRAKLTEREKELSEIEHALRSLERLREIEKSDAQIKISALELELGKSVSKKCKDGGLPADVSSGDSLKVQLNESRRRADQLQEKMLAVQKRQTLRQPLFPVKDEKPSVEGRKGKTIHPVDPETEQQRRMVTEQLKSLFKEREGKEAGKVDDTPSAAQTVASPPQDWTSTSSVVRAATDRRNWQHGSSLMPVFEDDEENSNSSDEEEGDRGKETHAKMSSTAAGIRNQMAKTESLLQALSFKQLMKNLQTADRVSNMTSHCTEGPGKTLPLYPDGIFLAEIVDICSPNEDEQEGELQFGAS